MIRLWKEWEKNHRYREVAMVCLPLVMSMAAVTVMEFTDRVFLSNYSLDAISAVAPAGIAVFFIVTVFGGVAGYTTVFIAQYCGAGAHKRVGIALWQGVYFSIFSGIFTAFAVTLIAKPLFALAGHAPEIQRLEVIYFKILGWGSIFHIGNHAFSGFFAGRGITRPVMIINAIGMVFNIPLDYALINGIWIFPELGISGAAIATLASWGLITLLYSCMIFSRTNHKAFLTRYGRYKSDIFFRLMRFGIPGGLQFGMDVFAFTFFVFMVGRIGKTELAVSNIVISINSLAFMPAMGFSYGVSALVGQALGRQQPKEAKLAAWSAIHILLAYTAIIDILFLFAPGLVLSVFIPPGQAADYAVMMETGTILLRIVAAYILMDALYMTFSGVLKGAGDTHFIMWSIGFVSLFVMILPVYIGIEVFQQGIEYAWICVLMFIISLFIVTSVRYRQGKWEKMLVVEREVSA
jgi:multidrug resistance protein, MATE family